MYDTGINNSRNSFAYTGPNVRVFLDRPYGYYGQVHDVVLSNGSGEFLLWEHPMSYWLEQQGYDVAYCSDLETNRDPDILSRSKVFFRSLTTSASGVGSWLQRVTVIVKITVESIFRERSRP